MSTAENFGQYEFVSEQARLADAVAVSYSHVYYLDRDTFLTSISRFPVLKVHHVFNTGNIPQTQRGGASRKKALCGEYAMLQLLRIPQFRGMPQPALHPPLPPTKPMAGQNRAGAATGLPPLRLPIAKTSPPNSPHPTDRILKDQPLPALLPLAQPP